MKSYAVPECLRLPLSPVSICSRTPQRETFNSGDWQQATRDLDWPTMTFDPPGLHSTSFSSTPHLPSFDTSALKHYISSLIFPICLCGSSSYFTFISLPLFSVHPVHSATCRTILSSALSRCQTAGLWKTIHSSASTVRVFSPDVSRNCYISWLGGQTH